MRPTFQVEPFATAWPDAQTLLRLHWHEIARDKDVIEMAPDVAVYEHLEKTGQLVIVTMRLAGELVGYHASMVRPHLHYKNSLTAYTDLYFIHADHRKGRNAWQLFKTVEEEMRRRGVQRMFASCKISLDLQLLFEALGWTWTERNFTKLLRR